MSGFSFPPPPPPPPKATQSSTNQSGHQYEPLGRGRGRGRGGLQGGNNQRGSSPSRGRGNSFSNASQQSTSSLHQNNFNAGIYHSTANAQHTQYQPQSHALPPGAFVNPRFGTSSNGYSAYGNIHNGHSTTQSSGVLGAQSGDQSGHPSRTAAGHKRKLEALRGPPREKKPGPQTAPSVPSFGAPLPQAKAQSSHVGLRTKAPHPPNVKPGVKSLGLTPALEDPQYSSSDSENDEQENDEEAMHAELGDKLTFEHNGVVMSLNSQADLAAWKKERQKHWPTKARMAEKDKERRRVGEERKRLLAGVESLKMPTQWKNPKLKVDRADDTSGGARDTGQPKDASPAKAESKLEAAKRELEEQTKRLDDLRKKVAESEVKNREAQARAQARMDARNDDSATSAGAEALDDENFATATEDQQNENQDDELDGAEKEIPESLEGNSSDSSSVISSDSASAVDSDDAPPEEVSTKPASDQNELASRKPVCRYFAASGQCQYGDTCTYRHEQRPQNTRSQNTSAVAQPWQRSNNATQRPRLEVAREKKSIFQRLVEQEEREEDQLALKVIKYLGSAGFFDEVATVQED